jgi:ribonucleoside-diphosphate reductase alpha chain
LKTEIPLSQYDSCRLLVLNTLSYVKDPFTSNARFDYELFYQHTRIAQRLMDDVIDAELEVIDKIILKIHNDPEPDNVKTTELELWYKIKDACSMGRRTGTGVTAIGDTVAALGLAYASDESIKVTSDIYKTLKLGCYRSSVDMAKQLGPFPVWDYDLEKDNPFLLRIKDDDPQLYEDMKKYGRRHIALLTTAPTGTVSLMTQTTSGIEPLFMQSYTRRKKINPNDKNSRVDFVDETGDSWQEFTVYHPTIKKWMGITGETDIKKSPWYGNCARDINWENRVKLQAAAQRHIDHAISSTINLPENVSVNEVEKIYKMAWKAGCKGITVYREGSRSGVLLDKSKTDSHAIRKTQAPKRPKTLPAKIHHIRVKGVDYFIIVGLFNGEPYEVFAGKEFVKIENIESGEIVKLTRGVYKLTSGNKSVLDNIANKLSADEEALTRLTSTALRHGADIGFIVHQLEKIEGDMQSFAKSVARALKKYISDGTKVHGETCETCRGNNIVRQEGCLICLDCGESKCKN